MATSEARVVAVRPRTIFLVLGITVLVGLGLVLVYLAWNVLWWIIIAIFLAMALNPAVEAFERRGLKRGRARSAGSRTSTRSSIAFARRSRSRVRAACSGSGPAWSTSSGAS
jgi:membrane protein implicated in regulation of membrane protease activity